MQTWADGSPMTLDVDKLIAEMEEVWRECVRHSNARPTMAILPGRYFRRVRTCRVGRWIVKGRWRVSEDALLELRGMGFDGAVQDRPIPSTLPRRGNAALPQAPGGHMHENQNGTANPGPAGRAVNFKLTQATINALETKDRGNDALIARLYSLEYERIGLLETANLLSKNGQELQARYDQRGAFIETQNGEISGLYQRLRKLEDSNQAMSRKISQREQQIENQKTMIVHMRSTMSALERDLEAKTTSVGDNRNGIVGIADHLMGVETVFGHRIVHVALEDSGGNSVSMYKGETPLYAVNEVVADKVDPGIDTQPDFYWRSNVLADAEVPSRYSPEGHDEVLRAAQDEPNPDVEMYAKRTMEKVLDAVTATLDGLGVPNELVRVQIINGDLHVERISRDAQYVHDGGASRGYGYGDDGHMGNFNRRE